METPGQDSWGSKLNPKLVGFMVISIGIGYTLSSLTPGSASPPTLAVVVVLSLVAWSVYGSMIHGFCKMIGGGGEYLDTLSVVLQLFSVFYVVQAFFALLIASGLKLYSITAFAFSEIVSAEQIGFFSYLLIQAIILIAYLPNALQHVHRFGRVRRLLLLLPVLVFIILVRVAGNAAIHYATGAWEGIM